MKPQDAGAIARAYHEAWSNGRYAEAAACLAPDLCAETPASSYTSRAEFAAAVEEFGGKVKRTHLLAVLSGDDEAVLIYDMDVANSGTIRIAEHFTVHNGRITAVRQIHDTAALRTAGFEKPR